MAMSIERLHEIIDQNPENSVLQWEGHCHDCKKDMVVTAELAPDNIIISGGAVYEPSHNNFIIKCQECFEKHKTLTNYQDCEVYSRVVGYLRPVNQFNPGKEQEYKDRINFKL